MTASEFAAVVGAFAIATIAVTLLLALWSLVRTLRVLRSSVEQLHSEVVPLVGQLRGTVDKASGELERVDGLLVSAESISATVDSASRLAYLFFANPVVKALAFGAGTARAARRFRRSPRD
jgi:uncharacterized protein YoxC